MARHARGAIGTILVWLVLVGGATIALAIVLAGADGDGAHAPSYAPADTPGPEPEAAAYIPLPGDRCSFTSNDPTASRAALAINEEYLEQYIRAASDGLTDKVVRMLAAGALWTEPLGRRCKVVDSGWWGVKVMVLEGPRAGDYGWTPAHSLRRTAKTAP